MTINSYVVHTNKDPYFVAPGSLYHLQFSLNSKSCHFESATDPYKEIILVLVAPQMAPFRMYKTKLNFIAQIKASKCVSLNVLNLWILDPHLLCVYLFYAVK